MEDPTENLINENEEQTQQPTRDAEVLQQEDAGTGAQANGTTDAQVDGINNTETFEATVAQADGTNRRLTSVVWNHFKKAKIEGVDKAICNYCGKKLSGKSKNGTTHLRDHYNICMARKNKDIRQTILNPRQEKKDGPVSLGTHTFDQNVSSKRKLVLDCKTRWNSTYLMLMSAIVYKDVFNRLVHIDKNHKQAPTDQDWHLANVMCEKLKLFYSVTEMFSGVKYPTANIFFPKICEIRLLLKECLISPYVEIKEMATNMISKFDQYWSLIHGILAIATILDPRFKMKLIEYYFPQIYGHESPKVIDRIRKLTYDLVKEYKPHDAKETHSYINNCEFGMDVDDFGDSLAGFDLFVSSTSNIDTYKSELDYYLEENVLPRTADFDILAWWKSNGPKYPTLQQVVKDVLAIPVSTVASESAFSTGGRRVTPHRNRLHPDLLETLICVQDWLWAENLGTHSNMEKHLAKFEVVKDDDSGPSYVDFDI